MFEFSQYLEIELDEELTCFIMGKFSFCTNLILRIIVILFDFSLMILYAIYVGGSARWYPFTTTLRQAY